MKKIIRDDAGHEDSAYIVNTFNCFYFVGIEKNIAESIWGNNNNHIGYMTHINQQNYFLFSQIHAVP